MPIFCSANAAEPLCIVHSLQIFQESDITAADTADVDRVTPTGVAELAAFAAMALVYVEIPGAAQTTLGDLARVIRKEISAVRLFSRPTYIQHPDDIKEVIARVKCDDPWNEIAGMISSNHPLSQLTKSQLAIGYEACVLQSKPVGVSRDVGLELLGLGAGERGFLEQMARHSDEDMPGDIWSVVLAVAQFLEWMGEVSFPDSPDVIRFAVRDHAYLATTLKIQVPETMTRAAASFAV